MTLNKWFDNEENECLIMTEGLVKNFKIES